jgi:hypothetical protein
MTNFTNDRNEYNKLLTCLTNITNDWINYIKLPTCQTNFKNDRINCAENSLPARRTIQIIGLTAENRLFA